MNLTMKTLAPVISYTGNKYRHLDTILSSLPSDIGKFYDVFGGSGVVGHNVATSGLASSVIYNEVDSNVWNMLFHALTSSFFELDVIEIDSRYPEDKSGYLKLREDFNNGVFDCHHKKYAALFVLHCRSFNNQIRFNKSGGFNLPYGDRNNIIPRLDARELATKGLKGKILGWFSMGFDRLLERIMTNEDPQHTFIFCDPPYLAGVTSYQETKKWSTHDEEILLTQLSQLDSKGFKWMLTNTTWNRGKCNEILIDWLVKNGYHVQELTCNHGNSSYYKSDKKTVEVLVMNY